MEAYIVARPLSTLDLPGGWQEGILSLYEEGGSDAEVKGLIYRMRGSFSNDLWDRWLNDEPEFSETIKMGRLLSEQWWHQQGRTNLKVQAFNYTGWYMQMKNRFGWADKQETSTKTEATITWKEERTYQQKDEANY